MFSFWISSLLRILIVFICIFSTFSSLAGEGVVIIKYGYGRLWWDFEKHEHPEIWKYPFEQNFNYRLSDLKNKINEERYKLKANLTVKQEADYLLANVSLSNTNDYSLYVHLSRLATKSEDFPLCGHAFSINTDNIRLDYIALRCQLDSDKEADFIEIPAGKTYEFSVRLNDAYVFPLGMRRYNIGSLEYSVVNDKWFVKQSINEHVIAILNWRYKICRPCRKLVRILCSCTSDRYNQPNIEDFLRYIDYDDTNDEDYFTIRTNQVVVMVDGDTLRSFYDKKTNE
ncbi:hypothetical protein [Escherichia sp. E4385]|uniref:hypothetical protein n=1 Tax=Escherichia sp. E4385 TaxID=2040639 RepID=UPI0010FE297D|nr:hypothetical protein [Escherichia sp. E4385]TLI95497.1 hypothetical protein FEK49_23115 [Escherichia sp. E4385]